MEDKIKKLSLAFEVDSRFRELENIITQRIKDTLEIFLEKELTVGVSFNREWFRMDIFIQDREYHISVQGKGDNVNKYLDEMLEIITKEIKL